MASLPDVVLPLALGGALLAGISHTGASEWRRGRRRAAAPGEPAGPGDATCGRCGWPAEGAPPGRLLLGVLPGVARLTGPGGRDGAVAGRGRAHPEWEDHELGGAGHSGLAGPGAGRQRQERPPPSHPGDAGAPGPGVVHRPDRLHGSTGQYLVTAHRLWPVA